MPFRVAMPSAPADMLFRTFHARIRVLRGQRLL
jgi:hypothetical protein